MEIQTLLVGILVIFNNLIWIIAFVYFLDRFTKPSKQDSMSIPSAEDRVSNEVDVKPSYVEEEKPKDIYIRRKNPLIDDSKEVEKAKMMLENGTFYSPEDGEFIRKQLNLKPPEFIGHE